MSCEVRGWPQYPSQGLMYKTCDKDNDKIKKKKVKK